MKGKFPLFNFDTLIATLLSFSGGLLELYCLQNRGFFGLMQTGNLIRIFTSIIDKNFYTALVSFLTVLFFVLGLIFSNILQFFANRKHINARFLTSLIITVLLALVILIPVDFKTDEELIIDAISPINLIANGLLAFVGAFTLESFTRFNDRNFTSTMMTANLTRLVDSAFKIKKDDQESKYVFLDYVFITVAFILGVVISYLYYSFIYTSFEKVTYLASYLPNFILFLPLLISLFISIGIYIRRKREKETQENIIK